LWFRVHAITGHFANLPLQEASDVRLDFDDLGFVFLGDHEHFLELLFLFAVGIVDSDGVCGPVVLGVWVLVLVVAAILGVSH